MSEFEEPKFTGSLAHSEPQYVLPLGLIGSFMVHAFALGMVRFAIVRVAGQQAVGESAPVEYVEVGPDGEILPPEKVAVVAAPKPAPVDPGPEDLDGGAIAAVPTPSPSLTPSPTPSPMPSQQPSPSPSAAPAPSPVLQQPKPKPVVQTPARSTVNPGPKPQSPTAEPQKKVNSPQPSSPPVAEPDPSKPVKGRPDIPPPPRDPNDIKKAEPTMDPPVTGRQASFLGIKPLPCVSDCTITDNVQLLRSPQEVMPVLSSLSGQQDVTVVALFDRDQGTMLPGSVPQFEPAKFSAEQYGELSRIINQFLGKCQFQFEATDTVATPPPVRLVLQLKINIK